MKLSADDLKQIKTRIHELDQQFETWTSRFVDLRDYILPDSARGLTSHHTTSFESNDGVENNDKIYDSTPTFALKRLSAGMQSGLTPPSLPWFRLKTKDSSLYDSKEVREYLDLCARIMESVLASSNFYTVMSQLYTELANFGTACIGVFEDFDSKVRFRAFTIGEYRLILNSKGIVDGMYRSYASTAGQLVQQFGYDNCSINTQTAYDRGDLEKKIDCYHIIEPNDDRITVKDIVGRPYRSIYYEQGHESSTILEVSGYEECPIIGARWDVISNNTYGHSPAMVLLPDIKTLNEAVKYHLIAVAKGINPPMMADSSMKNSLINPTPGGITYYTAGTDGQPGIYPLHQMNYDMASSKDNILTLQHKVSLGFYNDLFITLSNPENTRMTATEVARRHEEKLLLLSPTLNRLHSELLNPLIDRVFNILFRNEEFPIPPEELAGADLKIEYTSLLSQAQKMANSQVLERFIMFASGVAQLDPSSLDNIDFDELINKFANDQGVEAKILRDAGLVQAIRSNRVEQQKLSQQNEMLMQGADGAKTLSETDTSGKNALTDLM